MTKQSPLGISLGKERVSGQRKEMMRIMSEISYNPANVIPSKQEELAMFMVSQIAGVEILAINSSATRPN